MRADTTIRRAQARLDRTSPPAKPNGKTHAGAWTASLQVRGSHFVGNETNVLIALRHAPQLRGLVRYNDFRHVVEYARSPSWRPATVGESWSDHDDIDVQEWLQKANIDVRHRGIVADCVHRVARESNYHPVRNYLAALRWDEAPRLRSVLQTHFNATGSSDYLEAVGTKFFISAAARIQSPGCQVDHVLVLEGPQGTGKTSSTRVLAGEWVADGLPNLHDKDAAMHLQGVWIVELPELTAIRRTTDLEATKAFLSRTTDRIRPPYGRHMVEMKRQCVFIATTNQAQYLRDRTGNRRFWPVKCGAIDLQALIRDRDQLWAEAFALYQAGQAWHLTPAEAASARDQQAARVFVSELEQCVSMYLDGLVDSGTTQTTVGDVFRFGVHLDPDDKGFMELAGKHGPTVVEIMTTLGWHRVGAIGRGKKRRVIYHFAPETHRGS